MKGKLLYITAVQPQRDKPALTEATLWQALSDRSLKMGSGLLAYHEVAHAMRRYLLRDIAYQGDRK